MVSTHAFSSDATDILRGYEKHAGDDVAFAGRETLFLGNLRLVIDRLQDLFDAWQAHDRFAA